MKLTISVILAVFALCSADEDDHGHSPLLTGDTFDGEIAKEPHFVMFFAPW